MTQRLDYRALSPDGVKGLFAVQPYLIKAVPRPFLDIVWVRVSQINGCAYCVDQHTRDALQHGASERKLHHVAIWWESPLFDDRERAAMAYAEAVTRLEHQRVAEDVYQAARAHFDDRALTDLTLAIVAMNALEPAGHCHAQGPARLSAPIDGGGGRATSLAWTSPPPSRPFRPSCSGCWPA